MINRIEENYLFFSFHVTYIWIVASVMLMDLKIQKPIKWIGIQMDLGCPNWTVP
jgi:hypothetical protein